jgi:hypothetical protein
MIDTMDSRVIYLLNTFAAIIATVVGEMKLAGSLHAVVGVLTLIGRAKETAAEPSYWRGGSG